MNYWRMNLHPDDSDKSIKHTCECLVAGYIGLGFNIDPGDLLLSNPTSIHQPTEHLYWQFALEMQIGDIVAVFSHGKPFALVQVSGEYNYIKNKILEFGLWFNHFRKVENVRFFLDEYKFDDWDGFFVNKPPTQMTIQKHIDPNKEIYRFIDSWFNYTL